MRGSSIEDAHDPYLLIKQAKQGDGAAFDALYEMYFVPIFRYIYFRVRHREEAEDLTQTVFLKAYQALPGFKAQNKPPLAYFFTIARNSVIDYWRKKRPAISGQPVEQMQKADLRADPSQEAERRERMERLQTAIGRLSEEQQEVIILKFIEGAENKEIAKLLEKREDAVRQIQHRALLKLREHIDI